MQFEGAYRAGVIVLDEPQTLGEGTRVRIETLGYSRGPKADSAAEFEGAANLPRSVEESGGKTFLEEFGDLVVDVPGAPDDLAEQIDHYRLGRPKR